MKMHRSLSPPRQASHSLQHVGRHLVGSRPLGFLNVLLLLENPSAWDLQNHEHLRRTMLFPLHLTLAILLVIGGWASPLVAAVRPITQALNPKSLEGVWAFDGRSGCGAGSAWVFKADGSYSEIRLPDPTARGHGQWVLRGNTVFYSLALPEGSAARPLTKRMIIIEHSQDRLVAIAGRRVRHVMHRCR